MNKLIKVLVVIQITITTVMGQISNIVDWASRDFLYWSGSFDQSSSWTIWTTREELKFTLERGSSANSWSFLLSSIFNAGTFTNLGSVTITYTSDRPLNIGFGDYNLGVMYIYELSATGSSFKTETINLSSFQMTYGYKDTYDPDFNKSKITTIAFEAVNRNAVTNATVTHLYFNRGAEFIPVANILIASSYDNTTVPDEIIGVVVPSNASNQNIVWSVVNDKAKILNSNLLKLDPASIVELKAAIPNGLGEGINYTKTFKINTGYQNDNTALETQISNLITDTLRLFNANIGLVTANVNLITDTLRLFNANTNLSTANVKLITDTLRLFNTNTNLVTANVKSLDSIEVLLDSIDMLLSKLDLATPVTQILKSDNRYGIRFTQNIVSDKAEISVVLPNNERVVETKFVIYDMTGNVVFENSIIGSDVSWNLTNGAGRFVANGTYLVIAEVKGPNGKVYAYSAKLGVKR